MGGCCVAGPGYYPQQITATPYGFPSPAFQTVGGMAPPVPAASYLTPDDFTYKLNPSYPGAAFGATPLYL